MIKLNLPLFFTIVFLMLIPLNANAQSLCESGQGYLNRPAEGYGITSNMGPRNCAGCSRNHPGTDYATPCGTQIAGPPPGCVQSGSRDGISDSAAGSYGNYLQFDCGTNTAGEQISIQYAHLSNANYNASTNLITTGQSGSGGCHLDYIVTIDSQTIDAQCSTGSVESGVYSYGNSSTRHNVACPVIGQPNLCDPAVTTQLVEHGRQARGGVTTGPNISTGGGGTPPAPPDGPTTAPVTPTPGYPTSGPGGGGTTPSQPGVITGYDRDPDPARPPYQFPALQGRCTTTTCITPNTYNNANQNFMDPVDMEYDAITSGDCLPAIPSGTIVSRQGVGQLNTYPDRFCLNQGCSYLRSGDCQ